MYVCALRCVHALGAHAHNHVWCQGLCFPQSILAPLFKDRVSCWASTLINGHINADRLDTRPRDSSVFFPGCSGYGLVPWCSVYYVGAEEPNSSPCVFTLGSYTLHTDHTMVLCTVGSYTVLYTLITPWYFVLLDHTLSKCVHHNFLCWCCHQHTLILWH